jgi:copper resistance protein C
MHFAPRIGICAGAVLLMFLFGPLSLHDVGAHADLESASPPVGGTVTALPPDMTLTFSEEVKPGSAVIEVTGPDGARADTGDAAVDLTDPERSTVTVSLFAGGAGEYTVHWETVSNTDDDPSSGDYAFFVQPPVSASPTSAGTPINPTPGPTATEDPANGNPLNPEGSFDSRAFAISIGAGLLALAAIVGVWFAIRPRNPRFGPRARPDQGE